MKASSAFSSRQQRLCARPCLRAVQPSCQRHVAASAAAPATLLKGTSNNEGDRTWNQTFYPKGIHTDKTDREWYIIDAEGQTLGRMASLVAKYIRGKNSPLYTPSMDTGAMIIVVNAEKVTVTGRKFDQKVYKRHVNGLPGSMKVETFKHLQARLPERIVEKAVWGMLPKGRLGRKIKHNMFVYKGDQHPHQAQKPIDITDRINGRW